MKLKDNSALNGHGARKDSAASARQVLIAPLFTFFQNDGAHLRMCASNSLFIEPQLKHYVNREVPTLLLLSVSFYNVSHTDRANHAGSIIKSRQSEVAFVKVEPKTRGKAPYQNERHERYR